MKSDECCCWHVGEGVMNVVVVGMWMDEDGGGRWKSMFSLGRVHVYVYSHKHQQNIVVVVARDIIHLQRKRPGVPDHDPSVPHDAHDPLLPLPLPLG